MKRTSFFSALAAVALVAALVSCKKDKNSDPEPTPLAISASVTGDANDLALVESVKAVVPTSNALTVIATGTYASNKISITLPFPFPNANLLEDADAAGAKIANVNFIGYDENDDAIGMFELVGSNATTDVEGVYTYVDRSFSATSPAGSLTFKKGWNLYYFIENNGTDTVSNTVPAGITMTWIYNAN
ncbi:MAG: hypothetical protein LBH06_07660 [Rikenellaceae bacterium]|jgi:hypothetical protein|nr:hypothetical protein [Rikenellaceae bacterium]